MTNSQLRTQPNQRPSRHVRQVLTPTDVYCDFDGTITILDATDAVLEHFALPAWREWETRWVNGDITSQECLAQQVALIQADRKALMDFAADLPIDEGIVALDRRCAEHQVPLTIVSDGIDVLVEAVLHRHGLTHLPIYTNRLRWDTTHRPILSFPFAQDTCESGAGTCKCFLTRGTNPMQARPVYIGDGRSDQCVSGKIPMVFAKGALQQWCLQAGIPCIPFTSLAEVTECLFT